MKQVKISNLKERGHLVWSKNGNKVALKVGDNLIKFSSYPEWLNQKFPNVAYMATYNTKNELKFLSPWSGVFKAKFVGFAAKKDEKPAPVMRQGQFGEVASFVANIRLTDTKFNGMNVSIFLDHGKVDEDEDGLAYIVGESKAANLLRGLLEGTGIFYMDWKYSNNLLPSWQKAMKEKKQTFSVLFEKGYITKVIPSEEYSEEEAESESPFLDDEDETEDEFSEDAATEEDEDELGAF